MRMLVASLFCVFAAAPALAEPCRLSLALALDVSGSVDEREYQLQVDGLAAALSDPDVKAALFAIPGAPVAMAIYEWSASRYQRVIQDWVLIENPGILADVVNRLQQITRQPAPEPTGLAAALEFGKTLIEHGPTCWDQTLDVSGDGKNNDWPTPLELRNSGELAGLRINALVVIQRREDLHTGDPELGELSAYFAANIIQGPNAFVEVASGYEDYARAMQRKLLKELATRPVGVFIDDHRKKLQRF